MSIKEMVAQTASPKEIAESNRRLDAKKLAELVVLLCDDNMGQKLQTALSYENIDRDFRKD